MSENLKIYFQKIHYSKQKSSFALNLALSFIEFFYRCAITFKNFLYKKNILKEKTVDAYVICVGNLTTGGVGKTPIVAELANEISKSKKVAIISRGYKAKLNNKNPNVIKDFNGIKFDNGELCGDEPFQLAKKVKDNVVILTCKNRYKAAEFAIREFHAQVIILDDGFSNRKLKKDRTILVVDSMMQFGNGCLLPKGPLRESVKEAMRADEIIIANKGDKNIDDSVIEIKAKIKESTKKEMKFAVCKMLPKRIYNASTKAQIKPLEKQKAVAFCAIGQPDKFYEFLSEYYEVVEKVSFEDHHKYSKSDIKKLIKLAKSHNTNIFVTTQKDETKLCALIKDIKAYTFNVLELQNIIEEIT